MWCGGGCRARLSSRLCSWVWWLLLCLPLNQPAGFSLISKACIAVVTQAVLSPSATDSNAIVSWQDKWDTVQTSGHEDADKLCPQDAQQTLAISALGANSVYINPLEVDLLHPVLDVMCAEHYPSPCACPARPILHPASLQAFRQYGPRLHPSQPPTGVNPWRVPTPPLPPRNSNTTPPKYQRQATSSSSHSMASMSAVGLALKRAFRRSKNPLSRRLSSKAWSSAAQPSTDAAAGVPSIVQSLSTNCEGGRRPPLLSTRPPPRGCPTSSSSSYESSAGIPSQPSLCYPPLQRAASSSAAPSPRIVGIRRSASTSSPHVPTSLTAKVKKAAFSSSKSPSAAKKLANYHHLLTNSKSGMFSH